MLEALACGTPVAAYPVPGPIDVISNATVGVLDEDLRGACMAALQVPRGAARRHAEQHSWEEAVTLFEHNLAPIRPSGALAQQVVA